VTTILTTTGISLALNTARSVGVAKPSDDQIRQYLRADPNRASAEINALLRFAQADDRLVLLHTDTVEAERCAGLLQEFLVDRGFKNVRLIKLELQDEEQHLETRGLRNLVGALISEIERAQRAGDEVVINATAGLKAQVVYSTMLGMLYHVPVKYIYETFQRLVTFNPIPLNWDTNIILNSIAFFEWIDDQPRSYQEVQTRLKGLADRDAVETMLTPPDPGGDVYLSPMGEALYRRYRRETEEAEHAAWPPASDRSPKDKIADSIKKQKHHYPRRLLETCERIAELDAVHMIIGGFFESTSLSRVKGLDDEGVIRLLLADQDRAANLTVMTTARGRPQTLKVANQLRALLEI
jgi:putative CRISPR-associated protein (TIGR02619 family)